MVRELKSKDFKKSYGEFFEQDELKYALIWGIAQREEIVTNYIESRIGNEFIVGILAGKNLIIAANTNEMNVYTDMVEYMESIRYPGIIGVKEHCSIYNDAYNQVTKKSMKVTMDQRIYSCNKVSDTKAKEGIFRMAKMNEVPLLIEWAIDFTKGIEGYTQDYDETKRNILSKIESNVLYVLEVNGNVVSMAARSRALRQTESVGYVYTPIHLRGNGYASQVVRELTKLIIGDGRKATLYTDLSNPTSNSIYMKIGYEPHCDSVMMSKN
jgi:predicted GNAT family acetyltransferase